MPILATLQRPGAAVVADAERRSSALAAIPSGLEPKVRFGLAVRIAVWATLLGVITAGAIALFMYQGAVDALIGREKQGLSASVNAAALRLVARSEFARQDVLFLSRTLPVEGIVRAQLNDGVDPSDGVNEAEWERRLVAIFEALLESRPSYVRLRFIGVADGGREIVRVERAADGTIRQTPPNLLQIKGDRPFFDQTAKLSKGDVYVSEFELNQEFGKVVVPYFPVIRTATPVFDEAGTLRGEVIINVDAVIWFNLLRDTLAQDETLFVANQTGDYLVHPDPSKTFGFDIGNRHRMQDEIAGVDALFDDGAPVFSGLVRKPGGDELVSAKRVYLDPRQPDRYVVIAAKLDSQVLLSGIQAQRKTMVLIALGLIVGGAFFVVLLARAVTRPLRDLTVAATTIAAGGRAINIEAAMRRGDETGVLARAFAAMAVRIAAREEEIEAKAEELRHSNQELSQFAYVASHDLQEPLRMVSSYLGLLARRYRGKLDAEADEFIGYAVDGAGRMKRLINDLLGYSRVSNRPLNLETLAAGDIVTTAIKALDEQVTATGANIAVEPLPEIEADPPQMDRLFINLIENALKYHGDAPPQIRIAAARRDDFWEFSIADNGIGIEPEFREKVFEIFTRLHSRESYQGTGIGLASCRRIVERHGGRIWLDQAPGGGSIFRFTLPAARATMEKSDDK
jgi:signal transduction histidine kinase